MMLFDDCVAFCFAFFRSKENPEIMVFGVGKNWCECFVVLRSDQLDFSDEDSYANLVHQFVSERNCPVFSLARVDICPA